MSLMSSLLDEWFVTQSLWDPETHWDGPKSLKHICNENTVHRNNLYMIIAIITITTTIYCENSRHTWNSVKRQIGWMDRHKDRHSCSDWQTDRTKYNKKVDMIHVLTFWRQAGCQTNQTVWQLVEQEDGGSHRGWNQTSEVHSIAAG